MFSHAIASGRRHPAVALVLAALAGVILGNAAVQGDLVRALIYLGAVAAGVAVIDAVLARWPPSSVPIRIRGARLETILAAVYFLLGVGWLQARFVQHFAPAPGIGRLVWLAACLAFVFNLALALTLLARRYRLSDLGLRLTGFAPVPLIVAIFAVSAILFARSSITWSGIVEESGGSMWAVVATAASAAVPEEFFRFVWQTRVGAWLGNRATGWLVASLVWALLHFPKNWDESHALTATVMGVINIVPLGLLWGYLTHRTRSMLPSILLHGTNAWGLQNLI